MRVIEIFMLSMRTYLDPLLLLIGCCKFVLEGLLRFEGRVVRTVETSFLSFRENDSPSSRDNLSESNCVDSGGILIDKHLCVPSQKCTQWTVEL